jgi:hypothetical protein
LDRPEKSPLTKEIIIENIESNPTEPNKNLETEHFSIPTAGKNELDLQPPLNRNNSIST